MTDKYAVIGNPIAHSQSPRIHAMFARQTGQDMSYAAMLAPLDGFETTVRAFIAAGGCGVNVTVPFKEEACRLGTRLTDRARIAGASNTLLFDAEGIAGDNTDGVGLLRDIRQNLGRKISGMRVLLLGAGGAARGVILPLLLEHSAQLVIANRSAQKAQVLTSQIIDALADLPTEINSGIPLPAPTSCGLNQLAEDCFDIVINATSAGLGDNPIDIPGSVFAPGCLAYEMMYGRYTPFMAQAQNAQAQVSDGLGMLVEQAAEAFFLWRGVQPDTLPVLKALRGI
ncbi:MAG: shikimate dehydrogenase [Sterolibacterium sp.]